MYPLAFELVSFGGQSTPCVLETRSSCVSISAGILRLVSIGGVGGLLRCGAAGCTSLKSVGQVLLDPSARRAVADGLDRRDVAQDLGGQGPVLHRAPALRGVIEDRLSRARGFAQPDVVVDHGLEDHGAEQLPHLRLDLPAQRGPVLDERQEHIEVSGGTGVETLPNQPDRFQDPAQSFQRVVVGLDRHDHVGAGDQGADGQNPERRRAIHHADVVVVADGPQQVADDQLPVGGPRQLDVGAGQDHVGGATISRSIVVGRRTSTSLIWGRVTAS